MHDNLPGENSPKYDKILFGILVATLGIHLVLMIPFGYAAIFFPGNLIDYEQVLLGVAKRMNLGQPNYTKEVALNFPFVVPFYMPIYIWASSILLRFGGEMYEAGRFLSLISMVIAAVFLGLCAKNKTGSWRTALIAALFVFFSIHVKFWSILYRPDALSLLAYMAALALYFKNPKNNLILAATGFIMALGFWTKQSILATGGALVIYVFLGNPKKGFVLSALWVGLSGLAVAVANWLTDGGFWFQVWVIPKAPLIWGRLPEVFFEAFQEPLIVVGLFFSLWRILNRQWNRFEVIWFLIALAFGAVTRCYRGASTNYWLETHFAAALVMALAFHEVWVKSFGRYFLMIFISAISFQQALTQLRPLNKIVSIKTDYGTNYSDDFRFVVRQLKQKFKKEDRVFYQDPGLPLAMGHPIEMFNCYLPNYLFNTGHLKKDLMKEAIESRKYKAIVLIGDVPKIVPFEGFWFSKKHLQAIKDNYEPVPEFNKKQKIYSLFVLRPTNKKGAKIEK